MPPSHSQILLNATAGWRRRLARWVVGICLCLLVTGWVLIRWPGEAWWATTALAYAPQTMWLGLVAIALLAALIGWDTRSIVIALLMLPVTLFAFVGLRLNFPADPQTDSTLIVATWNIHDGYNRLLQLRRTIKRLAPDILLTQEANHKGFSEALDGYKCISVSGRRVYLRRASLFPAGDATAEGKHAVAPEILASRKVGLTAGWRSANEVNIKLGDRQVSLLDVHLVCGPKSSRPHGLWTQPRTHLRESVDVRRGQIADIATWAGDQDGPFIIAGDFNTPPHISAFDWLRPYATDAFAARGLGCGLTFKRNRPLWRIDYIWVSPHFRVLRSCTFDGGMSDHLGVWAELELL